MRKLDRISGKREPQDFAVQLVCICEHGSIYDEANIFSSAEILGYYHKSHFMIPYY